jgi:hypothetical protein
MRVYARAAVSEFLGDFVVYRNLVPVDRRLPGLDAIRGQVGLPAGLLPRKSEPEYARVIVHLLRQARALDAPDVVIQRLVYVGDTRLNDGTAFVNLCQAGGWPGLAFIAAETDDPPGVELVHLPPSPHSSAGQAGAPPLVFLANRWAALADFDRFCTERAFPIDAATAVVVDLDKTALGARGRNAHVIDQARVLAVRHTVADLLDQAFDPVAFQTAYDRLNQPEFHPFTADNQDYLAYVCLVLGGGLYDLEGVVSAVRAGHLRTFSQFIAQVDERANEMAPHLAAIHAEILVNVRAGDPTPFKPFRYNEYRTTVARMGHKADDAPVAELLAEEILITQEVRAQALEWRSRGALLFGLSDKPDEASIPSPELAAQGYRAIHQTATHAVGG